MNFLRKWMAGNEASAGRQGALWNMVASLFYSLQSFILQLVVIRVSGLVDGGVFTITYTVSQTMATIGSYGMRDFQTSDAKEEYKFTTYLSSRVVSVIAMVVICMAYALFNGYTGEKLLLIFIFCLYRVVDDVEDVFHGEMQRSLRFDVASKAMAIRIILSTALFVLSYILTGNLVIATTVLTVSAFALFMYLNIPMFKMFEKIKLKLTGSGLIKLLWVCLPICLGGFLYNYLVNAPKYAIESNLTDDVQSIFNILFMPIFAINMLSMFVFKPMVANMGITWAKGDKKNFLKMVLKQNVVIGAITVVLMALGGLCGTQVLGLLYGVDLIEHRWFLVMLIFFGGLAAFVAFYVIVITVMRQQKLVIVGYLAGALLEILLVDYVVQRLGMFGAGLMYGAGIAVALIVMIIVFIVFMLKGTRDIENE